MNKMKRWKPVLFFAFLFFLIVICGGSTIIEEDNSHPASKTQHYTKHYVIISDNMETEFWKTVYSSAKKEAERKGIYLEPLGGNSSEDYQQKDYLKISIAAKVDGIIICPDGSSQVSSLINQAVDKNIPVVTLINDDSISNRTSFVGINAYELGEVYGTQIIKSMTKKTKNIYLLFDTKKSTPKNDIVFNQIKSKLNSTLGEKHGINVQPYYISNRSEFEAEEMVRDIFVKSEVVPDILVCMDELDTECASQAVVDYNMVGDVTIIGSYSSDQILDSIQKNIISQTVAMDTHQLGQLSIRALDEYETMDYVSDYLSVNLNLINKRNVIYYQKQMSQEEDHE